VYGTESFLKKSGTVFCRRGERRLGRVVFVGGFIVVGGRGEAGGGRIGGGIFFSTVDEECGCS
jgi:hypothetical protein